VDYNCGGAARPEPELAPQASGVVAVNSSAVASAPTGAVAHTNRLKGEKREVSNFWDIVWLILSTFVFVAYLLVLFQIVIDLFRDHELGGGFKALWIIGLIFLPVMTALVYIVARGRGMAERQRAAMQRAKSDTDAYIRDVAGKSPADQIAQAKTLLDAGTINADEFTRLKAKALA
jgi:hypothetical protein